MKHEMTYRVPYADTDQMGVVYYANYLEYFERSRTEMLRSVGLPYSELEKQGIFLPVSEAYCRYLAPARYDDLLTFRSRVSEIKGVRMRVESEVRRGDELLVSGPFAESVHCRMHSLYPGLYSGHDVCHGKIIIVVRVEVEMQIRIALHHLAAEVLGVVWIEDTQSIG